jgi:hypothetical protein
MLNLVRYTQEEIDRSNQCRLTAGDAIIIPVGQLGGQIVPFNNLFAMTTSLIEKARTGSLHDEFSPKFDEDQDRKALFSLGRTIGLMAKEIEKGLEKNLELSRVYPNAQKQVSDMKTIANNMLFEGVTTKAALLFSMAKDDAQSYPNILLADIQRRVLETYRDLQKQDRQLD